MSRVVHISRDEALTLRARLWSGEITISGPTLFVRDGGVATPTYRYVSSRGAFLHSCGWRQMRKTYTEARNRQVEFTLGDRKCLAHDLNALGINAVLDPFIAGLESFRCAEPPDGPVVRRLLGDDSDMRRLLVRAEIGYMRGRLHCIDFVFGPAALHYTVCQSADDPLDLAFALPRATHRQLTEWYCGAFGSQQTIVVTYLRPAIVRPGLLRSFLAGARRQRVVYPGWQFSSVDQWPVDTAVTDRVRDVFLFRGPRASTNQQIDRFRFALPTDASAYVEIILGPVDYTFNVLEWRYTRHDIGRAVDTMHSLYGTTTNVRTLLMAHGRPDTRLAIRNPGFQCNYRYWEPLPLFARRFYTIAARLVEFVMALSSADLPTFVYDELCLWAGVGTFLLRKHRIAIIDATIVSCRRARQRKLNPP